MLELHLVDLDLPLVDAWRDAFADLPGVTIRHGDILSVAATAIVSPANSYGHMDGGIDADYAAYFGSRVQRAVYDAVARRPEGKIPVGAAEWIATDHARIPYLIVAPTMEVPERVPPSNSYRALRAALRLIATRREQVDSVYCPGLATGVGCVPPEDAAREMAAAYRDWIAERVTRKSEERQ